MRRCSTSAPARRAPCSRGSSGCAAAAAAAAVSGLRPSSARVARAQSRRLNDSATPVSGPGTGGRPPLAPSRPAARASTAAARRVAAAASAAGPAMAAPVYVGMDFGTSGARITAIDGASGALALLLRRRSSDRRRLTLPSPCHSRPIPPPSVDDGRVVFDAKQAYGAGAAADWAGAWAAVLASLLASLPPDVRARAAAVAFDGTSATAMLVGRASGAVLAPPKLYNESQAAAAVARAKAPA